MTHTHTLYPGLFVLPAHLSVSLSVVVPTVATCLSVCTCFLLSSSPSVSLFARSPVCLRFCAPKCFCYQRYFSFSDGKLSLHLTTLVSSAGDQQKSGISPLQFFLSSFLFRFLCFRLPNFASSSFPLSQLPHLSPSSLAYPCLYRPSTACSHSYGEYVSRKYYHTK